MPTIFDYPPDAPHPFINASNRPIYDGRPCCFCNTREGELVFAGYDEVLGELWIHPTCKKAMDLRIQQHSPEQGGGA